MNLVINSIFFYLSVPPVHKNVNETVQRQETITFRSGFTLGPVTRTAEFEVIIYDDNSNDPVIPRHRVNGSGTQSVSSPDGRVTWNFADFSIHYRLPDNVTELHWECQIKNFNITSLSGQTYVANVDITSKLHHATDS